MRFRFRLEKVLEYRASQEDDAKQQYLNMRATRFEGEAAITSIGAKRRIALGQPLSGLQARLDLEARMSKFDDEERIAATALTVMVNEEEAAEKMWQQKRQELKSIELLRERALTEWAHEEERREQVALDEWAVTRRRPK